MLPSFYSYAPWSSDALRTKQNRHDLMDSPSGVELMNNELKTLPSPPSVFCYHEHSIDAAHVSNVSNASCPNDLETTQYTIEKDVHIAIPAYPFDAVSSSARSLERELPLPYTALPNSDEEVSDLPPPTTNNTDSAHTSEFRAAEDHQSSHVDELDHPSRAVSTQKETIVSCDESAEEKQGPITTMTPNVQDTQVKEKPCRTSCEHEHQIQLLQKELIESDVQLRSLIETHSQEIELLNKKIQSVEETNKELNKHSETLLTKLRSFTDSQPVYKDWQGVPAMPWSSVPDLHRYNVHNASMSYGWPTFPTAPLPYAHNLAPSFVVGHPIPNHEPSAAPSPQEVLILEKMLRHYGNHATSGNRSDADPFHRNEPSQSHLEKMVHVSYPAQSDMSHSVGNSHPEMVRNFPSQGSSAATNTHITPRKAFQNDLSNGSSGSCPLPVRNFNTSVGSSSSENQNYKTSHVIPSGMLQSSPNCLREIDSKPDDLDTMQQHMQDLEAERERLEKETARNGRQRPRTLAEKIRKDSAEKRLEEVIEELRNLRTRTRRILLQK